MPRLKDAVQILGGIWATSPVYAQALGRAKRPQPRHLISEECIEFEEPPYYIDNGVAIQLPGPISQVTVWRFHYSDDTTESVTRRSVER